MGKKEGAKSEIKYLDIKWIYSLLKLLDSSCTLDRVITEINCHWSKAEDSRSLDGVLIKPYSGNCEGRKGINSQRQRK